MDIADKITLLRERAGWTKRELARRIGLIESRISKWEAGQGEPYGHQLQALADAFDVPVEFLTNPARTEVPDSAELKVLREAAAMGFEEAWKRLMFRGTPAREIAHRSLQEDVGEDVPPSPPDSVSGDR